MNQWIVVSILTAFAAGSMLYAYRFRGHVRFTSLSEYLRKGWPVFTPLNCVLYLFTERRARRPIMDSADFSELDGLRENWQIMREEALDLYEKGYFEEARRPGSAAYFDVGFRTFYKYGWSKFYLKWYGYTHRSALQTCPRTVALLKQFPTVNGAMFSLLPAGSQLTRHLDPFACSLRYHLGLCAPDTDACYISIDGVQRTWRNGETLIFDETHVHFARNDSDRYRLILMCDIERPLHFPGNLFNLLYKGLVRLSVVPNLEGDKRGLASALFARLAPLLQRTRQLKASNRTAYLVLKYTVNAVLILLLLLMATGLIDLVARLVV